MDHDDDETVEPQRSNMEGCGFFGENKNIAQICAMIYNKFVDFSV
jgi:hypothetical protein